MKSLLPCRACGLHVKSNESACPHCGATLSPDHAGMRRAGSVLVGLALAGCPSDDGGGTEASTVADTSASTTSTSNTGNTASTTATTGESMSETSLTDPTVTSITTEDETFAELDSAYGVPDTGESFTTDPSSSDGTGSTGTGTTGTDGTGTSSGSAGEPDYGVPETG